MAERERIVVVHKRSPGCFTLIVLPGILAIIAFYIFTPSKPVNHAAQQQKVDSAKQKQAEAKAAKQKQIEDERPKQPQRLALIQRWQNDGTFGKIEHRNNLVEVRVKAPWYVAAIDDKRAAANVIWGYWYIQNQSLVMLKFTDDTNGKDVATYSDQLGLKIK